MEKLPGEIYPFTQDQLNGMINHLFGQVLAPDLQKVVATRTVPLATTLEEANSSVLQGLYTKLNGPYSNLDRLTGQAKAQYLALRSAYARNGRDQWGRPSFLETVPSARDSAAQQVVHDLNYPTDRLVRPDGLAKIYDTQDGMAVTVPYSAYAGYYLSLMVPENGSPLVKMTAPNSNPGRTFSAMGRELAGNINFRQRRQLHLNDGALLYATGTYLLNFPEDHNFSDQVIETLGSGMRANSKDQAREILLAGQEYPKRFTKIGQRMDRHPTRLHQMEVYLWQLKNQLAKLGFDETDQLVQAQELVAQHRRHQDPGLLSVGLKELLIDDNYPTWISGLAQTAWQLTDKVKHAWLNKRQAMVDARDFGHQFSMTFDHVEIPWQFRYLFSEIEVEQVDHRLELIDGSYDPNRRPTASLITTTEPNLVPDHPLKDKFTQKWEEKTVFRLGILLDRCDLDMDIALMSGRF